MPRAIILIVMSAVLAACSTFPRLEPDAGRRASEALQAALAAYCRLSETDRDALRRALAERHGLELPRAIACRGQADAT